MDDPRTVVDVDDPSTWPSAVLERAQMLADQLRGTTEYTNDLAVPLDGEDEFRTLLSGHLVRVFHATRLLDHEVQEIRAQGLQPLSEELLGERINAAHERSFISEQERDLLRDSHVTRSGDAIHRFDRVCLVVPESALEDMPGGFEKLLSLWGGEAMWKATRDDSLLALLSRLGKPSIVVASIDLSAGQQTLHVFPDIRKVFAGHRLGLRRAWADVHYFSAIPPEDVEAIWQPGDPKYDRFEDLPRS